jgi:hypothetical protein
MIKIDDLFDIEYGQHEYNSKGIFKKGETPLISSQGSDNGCYGFFSITPKYKAPIITVPRTGSIGEAFVQNHDCCVDDNCLVLLPKEHMAIEYLYYIAIMIRSQKWRFMYGRQITPERLGKIEVDDKPIEFKSPIDFKQMIVKITPKKKKVLPLGYVKTRKDFYLSELFKIKSGDYHAKYKLESGNIPLISCGDLDNGLIGFYDIPKEKQYSNTITVAYNGIPLTTRFHPYIFGAKDDVAICINSNQLRLTTIIFIGMLLNRLSWRFSYGRKCFQNKLKYLKISLPIDAEGNLEQDYMEGCVKNTSYWDLIENKLNCS